MFDPNSPDVEDELLLTAYEHVVAFGRWVSILGVSSRFQAGVEAVRRAA